MPPSKTQRWLDLIAVLVGRRHPLSFEQIMELVPAYRDRWVGGNERARASVRRMFERDKDELRRLGIPLVSPDPQAGGTSDDEGYLIPKGDFYLPYLDLVADAEALPRRARRPATPPPHSIERVTLTEDEARTAIVALREVLSLPSFPFRSEARTALRKLTFDLEPEPGDAGDAGPGAGSGAGPRIRILDRPGGADPRRVMGVLLDALYDRRRIRLGYRSIGRDEDSEREVEPWGLLFQWGAWYLAAHDPARAGDGPPARLFRVDRVADAAPVRPDATAPDFEVPGDFDIRAFADRRAWELGGDDTPEAEIVVRFPPPVSLLAARNGWGESVEEAEDGTALRRFVVRRPEPLLRWVLSFAGEADVVAPPEAVAAFRKMAHRAMALHASAPPDPGETP